MENLYNSILKNFFKSRHRNNFMNYILLNLNDFKKSMELIQLYEIQYKNNFIIFDEVKKKIKSLEPQHFLNIPYIPKDIISIVYYKIDWNSLDYNLYDEIFFEKYIFWVNFHKISNIKRKMGKKFIQQNYQKLDINKLIINNQFIDENILNFFKDEINVWDLLVKNYTMFDKMEVIETYFLKIDWNIFSQHRIINNIVIDKYHVFLNWNIIIQQHPISFKKVKELIKKYDIFIDYDLLLKTYNNLDEKFIIDNFERFKDIEIMIQTIPENILMKKMDIKKKELEAFIKIKKISPFFFQFFLKDIIQYGLLNSLIQNNLNLINNNIVLEFGHLLQDFVIWDYISIKFQLDKLILFKYYLNINLCHIKCEYLKNILRFKIYLNDQEKNYIIYLKEKCSICFECDIDISLECGHFFCIECSYKWFLISENCPICRKPCEFHSILRSFFRRFLEG